MIVLQVILPLIFLRESPAAVLTLELELQVNADYVSLHRVKVFVEPAKRARPPRRVRKPLDVLAGVVA